MPLDITSKQKTAIKGAITKIGASRSTDLFAFYCVNERVDGKNQLRFHVDARPHKKAARFAKLSAIDAHTRNQGYDTSGIGVLSAARKKRMRSCYGSAHWDATNSVLVMERAAGRMSASALSKALKDPELKKILPKTHVQAGGDSGSSAEVADIVSSLKLGSASALPADSAGVQALIPKQVSSLGALESLLGQLDEASDAGTLKAELSAFYEALKSFYADIETWAPEQDPETVASLDAFIDDLQDDDVLVQPAHDSVLQDLFRRDVLRPMILAAVRSDPASTKTCDAAALAGRLIKANLSKMGHLRTRDSAQWKNPQIEDRVTAWLSGILEKPGTCTYRVEIVPALGPGLDEHGFPLNHVLIRPDGVGDDVTIERGSKTQLSEQRRRTEVRQVSFLDFAHLLAAGLFHGGGKLQTPIVRDEQNRLKIGYKGFMEDCWTHIERVLRSSGEALITDRRVEDEAMAAEWFDTRTAKLMKALGAIGPR